MSGGQEQISCHRQALYSQRGDEWRRANHAFRGIYRLLSSQCFVFVMCCSGSRVQQDTALQQWKACLSI
jgi:hypothetical protein